MKLTLYQALRKGVEAYKAGRIREADQIYTAILRNQPENTEITKPYINLFKKNRKHSFHPP